MSKLRFTFKAVLVVILAVMTIACGQDHEAAAQRAHEKCMKLGIGCPYDHRQNLNVNQNLDQGMNQDLDQGFNDNFDDNEGFSDNHAGIAGAAIAGTGAYGAYKLINGKKYVKDRKGKWIPETVAAQRKQQSDHQKALNEQKAKDDLKANKVTMKNQKKANTKELKSQKACRKAKANKHKVCSKKPKSGRCNRAIKKVNRICKG